MKSSLDDGCFGGVCSVEPQVERFFGEFSAIKLESNPNI